MDFIGYQLKQPGCSIKRILSCSFDVLKLQQETAYQKLHQHLLCWQRRQVGCSMACASNDCVLKSHMLCPWKKHFMATLIVVLERQRQSSGTV